MLLTGRTEMGVDRTGLWILGLMVAGLGVPAMAQTFSNPTSIAIPGSGTSGPASPYPSAIVVSGLGGTVGRIEVSLFGVSHTFPDDIDVLLVGPSGANVLLMSDCGTGYDISNVDLTFADDGPPLPENTQIVSGTYQPTNYGVSTDLFAAPAPVGPYGGTLSSLRGTEPNGTWQLFVMDDAAQDTGGISGGWSITFFPEVFTYQGQLKQNGVPFMGAADLQFRLLDIDGGQVGSPQVLDSVGVTDGLFTVEINSGSEFGGDAFDGGDRFLEVAVAVPPGSAFVPLAPVQPLNPTPYAHFASGVPWSGITGTPDLALRDHTHSSLDASDGSPTDVLVVGATGNVHIGTFVGIGTSSPMSRLHVSNGTSGGAAQAGAGLLVEDNSTCYINMMAPDASEHGLTFGSPASSVHGGVYYTNSTGMDFRTGSDASRMTIDSTGNVGIGTTTPANKLSITGSADVTGNVGIGTSTPAQKLHVFNGSSGGTSQSAAELLVEDNSSCYINLMAPDASEHGVSFGSPTSSVHGGIYYKNTVGMDFRTGDNASRITINSVGDVGIGVGVSGGSIDAKLHVSKAGRAAKFDRAGSDGELLAWARDDGVVGNVTVAGGVVSYNAFTGSHWAWLSGPLERGTLVTLTGDNRASAAGGEVVYGAAITTQANDPACLGAYLAPCTFEERPRVTDQHQIMSVGNGELWVVDRGRDIAPGDLLISSDVPGCAMKDDPARFPIGYVVARAAEIVRWPEVTAGPDGLRRARISVLFDRFARVGDPATTTALLEEIATLQKEIIELRQLKAEWQQLRQELGNLVKLEDNRE